MVRLKQWFSNPCMPWLQHIYVGSSPVIRNAPSMPSVIQGWCQKFSNRGAGASNKGAKMTEKWCFRALFCQISSDENRKFPPTGGARFFRRRGGCSPLTLPWCQPCRNTVTDLKLPRKNSATEQKCFSYRGAKLWNSLSAESKQASSLVLNFLFRAKSFSFIVNILL